MCGTWMKDWKNIKKNLCEVNKLPFIIIQSWSWLKMRVYTVYITVYIFYPWINRSFMRILLVYSSIWFEYICTKQLASRSFIFVVEFTKNQLAAQTYWGDKDWLHPPPPAPRVFFFVNFPSLSLDSFLSSFLFHFPSLLFSNINKTVHSTSLRWIWNDYRPL